MKIAILTQPLRTNYGGILQNYALQQCLESMGNNVFTLDDIRIVKYSKWKYPLTITKRIVQRILGTSNLQPILYEHRYKCDYKEFTKYTRDFVNKHIKLYPFKNLYKDLAPSTFDVYVVGSDQIWRPDYYNIFHAFLDFTNGWKVKRIAYAVSFGKDEWMMTDKETEKCKLLACNFDAVSVREVSGIKLCGNHLGIHAIHVIDPTLLLSKEDYSSLVDMNKTKKSEGTMFVHILDKSKEKSILISQLSKMYHATPFSVCQLKPEENLFEPIEERIQPPIEQWLRAFIEAEYVVTDSFHASVFSIIFNKRFLVIANADRGLARIKSLLSLFGLEKCLINNNDKQLSFPEIDYNQINKQIIVQREKAINFLKSYL